MRRILNFLLLALFVGLSATSANAQTLLGESASGKMLVTSADGNSIIELSAEGDTLEIFTISDSTRVVNYQEMAEDGSRPFTMTVPSRVLKGESAEEATAKTVEKADSIVGKADSLLSVKGLRLEAQLSYLVGTSGKSLPARLAVQTGRWTAELFSMPRAAFTLAGSYQLNGYWRAGIGYSAGLKSPVAVLNLSNVTVPFFGREAEFRSTLLLGTTKLTEDGSRAALGSLSSEMLVPVSPRWAVGPVLNINHGGLSTGFSVGVAATFQFGNVEYYQTPKLDFSSLEKLTLRENWGILGDGNKQPTATTPEAEPEAEEADAEAEATAFPSLGQLTGWSQDTLNYTVASVDAPASTGGRRVVTTGNGEFFIEIDEAARTVLVRYWGTSGKTYTIKNDGVSETQITATSEEDGELILNFTPSE